jgi:hypothetical protein
MHRLIVKSSPALAAQVTETADDDTFFVSLCLALFLSGLVVLTLAMR